MYLDKVKTFFSQFSKEVKIKLKKGSVTYSFSKTEWERLHEMLYQETRKSKDTEYLVRFQHDILLEFLEDEFETLENFFRIFDGFHLLADTLHFLFYHANQRHFHFYSGNSVLSTYVMESYIEKHYELLTRESVQSFEDLLLGREKEKNKIALKKIWEIFSRISPRLSNHFQYVLFDSVLRFIDPKQEDFEGIIACVRNVRKPFHLIWKPEDWVNFLGVLRSRHIKGNKSNYTVKWIRAIESQHGWEDIYEFIEIAGLQEIIWEAHKKHFLMRWKTFPFDDMVKEVEFQAECYEALSSHEWKSSLHEVLSKIFVCRPDFDAFVIEKIHQSLLAGKGMGIWKKYLAYRQDKDTWLNLYQSKLRERLLEIYDYSPNIEQEKQSLKELETFFEPTNLLNLKVMINNMDVCMKEPVHVFVLNKFVWGITKNPFACVRLPSFLELKKIPNQMVRLEILFNMGSVVLRGKYERTSLDILMYPIQAVILLGIQNNEPEYENIEEVYEGLAKDGLIMKTNGKWRFCSEPPSIVKCSRWSEKVVEKKLNQVQTEHRIEPENFHLDAFLCRLMKNHRQLHHDELLHFFLERFPCLTKGGEEKFENRINNLMEREFICKENRVYNYIP